MSDVAAPRAVLDDSVENDGVRPVSVRLLDLRVRRARANAQRARCYAVLRVGDAHHRTRIFPAEGLHSLESRRTLSDDRQFAALQPANSRVSSDFWQIPTDHGARSCRAGSMTCVCSGEPAAEHESRSAQYAANRIEATEADEQLRLEIYNPDDTDAGLSIDGFDAQPLVVLSVNLASLDVADRCIRTDVSRQERWGACDPLPRPEAAEHTHSSSCEAPDANRCGTYPAELRRRTDAWFGGVVSSSAGSREDDQGGFAVEARLEILRDARGPCRLETAALFDKFGQAVHPRNQVKCSSAQSLWKLQAPFRAENWSSKEGRDSWAHFLTSCRPLDPLTAPANGAMDGAKDWGRHLRELVWSGVPEDMREEVYMSLSGAGAKRESFPGGHYQALVAACHDMDVDDRRMRALKARETFVRAFPEPGAFSPRMQASRRFHSARADTPESERPALVPKPQNRGINGNRQLPGNEQQNKTRDSPRAGDFSAARKQLHADSSSPVRSTLNGNMQHPRVGHELSGISTPLTSCRTSMTPSASPDYQERAQVSPALEGHGHIVDTIAEEDHSVVWREIEADLDRTFINGRTKINTPSGMISLRRLLRAFALHNPAIGYCQGMNFVAGLLLEVVSEEAAFWLLAVFCEDLHADYHTKSMLGARADIAALKDVVRKELPTFHARAREVDMPLELKLTQWLLVGFVNCFPPCTSLRIMEVSFLEGSNLYLATALAFLRLHEVEISEGRDIAEVVCTLDLAQAGMYDADLLLAQVRQNWRTKLWMDDQGGYKGDPPRCQAQTTVNGLLADGKGGPRHALVPLMVGGLRWLLGWKAVEA